MDRHMCRVVVVIERPAALCPVVGVPDVGTGVEVVLPKSVVVELPGNVSNRIGPPGNVVGMRMFGTVRAGRGGSVGFGRVLEGSEAVVAMVFEPSELSEPSAEPDTIAAPLASDGGVADPMVARGFPPATFTTVVAVSVPLEPSTLGAALPSIVVVSPTAFLGFFALLAFTRAVVVGFAVVVDFTSAEVALVGFVAAVVVGFVVVVVIVGVVRATISAAPDWDPAIAASAPEFAEPFTVPFFVWFFPAVLGTATPVAFGASTVGAMVSAMVGAVVSAIVGAMVGATVVTVAGIEAVTVGRVRTVRRLTCVVEVGTGAAGGAVDAAVGGGTAVGAAATSGAGCGGVDGADGAGGAFEGGGVVMIGATTVGGVVELGGTGFMFFESGWSGLVTTKNRSCDRVVDPSSATASQTMSYTPALVGSIPLIESTTSVGCSPLVARGELTRVPSM